MIGLNCPACGCELDVGDLQAGQELSCPKCRQPVLLVSGSHPIESPTRRADSPSTNDSPQRSDTIPPGADSSGGRAVPLNFDFLSPPKGADGIGWLGPYRIIKLIGTGGMGMVFLAEDSQLQRKVALKVVRPEKARDPELRGRFLREARAMAAVKSDYIVDIYQVGEANSLPFLAMEYLEGENLEERLHRELRPDLSVAVRVARETALGLAATHERGLVHRDIKPGNLFIESRSGRVKILDFGLAFSADMPSNLTAPGIVMGTPEYMSPEQAEGSVVSEKTDLFSLGCVLYRMLSGKKAFGEGSTMAVLKAVMMTDPVPLAQVNPQVPPGLADLTSRLLAKEAARRPPSAQAVAGTLQTLGLLSGSTTPLVSPSHQVFLGSHSPSSAPNRRPGQKRLGIRIAVGAIVFLGVFLGGLMIWRHGGFGNSSENAGGLASSAESTTKGTVLRPSSKTDPGTVPASVKYTLNGGGSTLIYPLIEKWGSVYRKEKSIKLNYVPTGSGAGIQQILAGALDFCCSDLPMTNQQLQQARQSGNDVIHIPLALGGIVPAYNLPGLEKPVRFSGPVLADIFLGKITRWNDPALREINPGMDLPDLDITVIHRSDSSGSTYIFTDFLSKVSKEWEKKFGASALVKWPVGVRASAMEGMLENIAKTPGALGYIELLYALQSKIKFGLVKNRAGNYVEATLDTVVAAVEAAPADIPADLRFTLTYGPGKNAYPICGCTWAILHVRQPDGRGQRLVEFVRWAMQEGQEYNTDLFYARLPASLAERASQLLDTVQIER